MLEVQTEVDTQTKTKPKTEAVARTVADAGPWAKVETETNKQTGTPNMQARKRALEWSSDRAINQYAGNANCSHSCSFTRRAPAHAFNVITYVIRFAMSRP